MVSELPDYLKKPTFTTPQQRQADEMEQRVEEMAAALKAIHEQNAAIQKAVAATTTIITEIQPVVADLAAWKPTLEKSLSDVQQELGGVRKELDVIARNPVLRLKPGDLPPIFHRPEGAPQNQAGSSLQGPEGHRVDQAHRGVGSGVVTTLVPPPVTGMAPSPNFLSFAGQFSVDHRSRGPQWWGSKTVISIYDTWSGNTFAPQSVSNLSGMSSRCCCVSCFI